MKNFNLVWCILCIFFVASASAFRSGLLTVYLLSALRAEHSLHKDRSELASNDSFAPAILSDHEIEQEQKMLVVEQVDNDQAPEDTL